MQAAWTLRYAFDNTISDARSSTPSAATTSPDLRVGTTPSAPSKAGFAVDPTTISWEAVNDSVMGGVSYSTVTVNRAEATPFIHFKGYATTASNGGFASARSYGSIPVDFSGCRGISIEVKGDGQKYGFDIRNSANTWRSPAYEVAFNPTDQWTVIDVPFTDLVSTWMGRANFNDRLVDKRVYSFGLKRSAFTGGYKDSSFRSGNFDVKLRNMWCLK
jgi:hypothetical protein